MISEYLDQIDKIKARLKYLYDNSTYMQRGFDTTLLDRIRILEDELLDLYLAVHLMSK